MEKNNTHEDNRDEIENIEKPSYTYWKRESDKPFSNEYQPKKSDSFNSQQISNQTAVGSAWNKAGTWEEKHYNKSQVEEYFNKFLSSVNNVFSSSFIIEKMTSFGGDCYSVFVRGKKKFVHDCEFTLNISGVNDFTNIKGEVKLSDVTNHSEDDDFEFDFSSKFIPEDDAKSGSLLSKVKNAREDIQDYIRKIFNEMKEKL